MATEAQGQALNGHILAQSLEPLKAGEMLHIRLITSDKRPVDRIVFEVGVTLLLPRQVILREGDSIHIPISISDW